MSTVTENDIKELKDLINAKFEKVDAKFEKLDERLVSIDNNINNLKIDLATITEKINSNTKRVDNVDFIIRTIFVGIVSAIILGVFKFLYPFNP